MLDYLDIGVAQGEHAEMLMVDERIRYVGVDMLNEVDESVLERLKPYGNRIEIITINPKEVLPTLTQKFDRIYINGDHSYEGAKKDMELSLPLLKNWSSRIVVDDLNYKEVRQAFDEFVKENNLEHKGNEIWQR